MDTREKVEKLITKRVANLQSLSKYLDLRMGALGAISMGLIVYWINMDHGLIAVVAALKQALYTFFFGALFVRMAENISVQFANRTTAVLIGGGTPAILTAILTYMLHAIKGTPEPFYSTLPTLLLGSMSFCTWSYLRHRAFYKED